MNKIICDKCGLEIKQEELVIENEYPLEGIEEGIIIQVFTCTHCKAKYAIDVTDKETRIKQFKIAELREYKEELETINVSKEHIEEKFKIYSSIVELMENLLKEIKITKAELKIKYVGEL